MSKLRFLFFGLAILCSSGSFSQDAVRKVSKNYFRSDPFAADFSDFVKHLINDPSIKDRDFTRRSDTSLFYLHGTYSNYNPFFFKPARIEVVLAETRIRYADTLDLIDTIMLYQLVAYSEPNAGGIADVKKEFEKIHKQISRGFSDNNYDEQKNGTGVSAAWHNYFVRTHAMSPVTLTWGLVNDGESAVLNITMRLKSSNNKALLPAPVLPGM